MGDDVEAPHSYHFELSSDATFGDLFNHLTGKRYLVSVAGRNDSWQAMNAASSIVLLIANSHIPVSTDNLQTRVSKYASEDIAAISFRHHICNHITRNQAIHLAKYIYIILICMLTNNGNNMSIESINNSQITEDIWVAT